jgi:hypothetical protein
VSALVSEMPKRNGWTIAEHAGDRSPDRMQRLLNRASWDTLAAMSEVRRFAAAGLAEAARRSRRRGGLVIGALDETGQEKRGTATAGVKRVPLENRIKLVTCGSSGYQAACAYSLIRPPRTGFRWIRSRSRSVTVIWPPSCSPSGTRWAMPWCGRAVL